MFPRFYSHLCFTRWNVGKSRTQVVKMGLLWGSKSPKEIMEQGAKSEEDLKVLVTEATKHGALHCKLFFDAHGTDKKAVEDALLDFITQLSKANGVLLARGQIERSIEHSDMYSASAFVELVVDSFSTLVIIALKFAPIGIELLQPAKITLEASEAQNIVMDASQSTQAYSRFVQEKTMTEEEKAKLAEQLKRRAEFGAKLRDKTGKKEEAKQNSADELEPGEIRKN